ncbi:flagellar protein FliT [Pseudomonadota bacterium]|nr:flagellar protein FliT [Pseudomonadota bacterium]
MKTKCQTLSKVLALSESMLKKAEAKLWEELMELEQQRQLVIESTFPIDNTAQNERIILQKIVALNKQLEQQCIKAKSEVQQQLLASSSKKKAMSAYQQK